MDREIKFRVWDKDYAKMHICGENIHDSISFLEGQAIYYNLQNGCGSLPDGTGTYDLMQYTGTQDKNGKDIYEGDIVEFKDFSEGAVIFGKQPFGRNVVKWNFKKGGWKVRAGMWFEGKNYEVIGNIYEDPDLLESASHV